MALSEERAFLLASYALQADYGNYTGALQGSEHYFTPGHYFPAWVVDRLGVEYISRHLPTLHLDHAGMSKSEAQSMYIKEASDAMAPHNFHLYPLTVKKGGGGGGGGHGTPLVSGVMTTTTANGGGAVPVWLAITISGIAIYGEEISGRGGNHNSSTISTTSAADHSSSSRSQLPQPAIAALKTRISFFPWSDIGKLSFEKKKFEIRSTGPQGRKFVYHSASEEISRHLLWFSRASHQFHLMVQQKMKEMLKREAEISRRKYRESCISSISTTTTASSSSSAGTAASAITTASSSSGNSSGSSVPSSSSSNNTSKSASPFEFSNTSGSNGSLNANAAAEMVDESKKCPTDAVVSSDKNHHAAVSATNSTGSSVLCDPSQRVSVISNVSSNTTTSGIVSDKGGVGVGSGLGSERSQDSDREDLDLLDGDHHHHHEFTHHHNLHHHNLHHHHHHHHGVINRAITLSGCSSQPVVSLESLALSEPIEHRSCRSGGKAVDCGGKLGGNSGGLAANKKHSISISNIMITSSTTPTSTCSMATSGISSSSSSSSSSSGSDHLDDHHLKCPVSASSCLDSSYASSEVSSSTSASPVANLPSSSSSVTTSITVPSFKAAENHEVLVTGGEDNSSSSSIGSKVLRLNINESFHDSGDECTSEGDESSSNKGRKHRHSNSSSSHHHHRRHHHHSSGNRSNVTVLSTILKPEAERLLKQAGIEVTTSSADEAAEQLMIQQSQTKGGGDGGLLEELDSSQLAELKEFEQAEKEKIILNSLINKLPPPPPMSSSEEEEEDSSDSSSSSSDSSDSSSDDSEDEGVDASAASAASRHCYSPLSMEKQAHHHKHSHHHQPIRSSPRQAASSSGPSRGTPLNRTPPKQKAAPSSISLSSAPSSKSSSNQHIYENLRSPVTVNNSGSCKTLSEWRNLALPPPQGLPPPVPLRPNGAVLFSTPKTAAAATAPVATPCLTPHRTGMRIGVSSLSRPYGGPRTKHSLLAGACVQTPTGGIAHVNAAAGAGVCGCSAAGTPRRNHNHNNLFDVSAGSEPNLYWQSSATTASSGWPSAGCPRALAANKSDSVFDCRVIGAGGTGFVPPPPPLPQMYSNSQYHHQHHHLLQPVMASSPVANGFSSLPPNGSDQHGHHPQLTQQDSNNNIEKDSAAAYLLRSPMTSTANSAQHSTTTTTPNTASQHVVSCASVSLLSNDRLSLKPFITTQNHNRSTESKNSSPNKADSISDLHQLRQRSSDLNLPLITALFNDSSLMDQLSEQKNHHHSNSLNKMSQSMSQIPQRLSSSPSNSNHNNSGHHHHPSGATVERTSTFRVDEAIAKSTLRQHQLKANDNNNNLPDYTTTTTPVHLGARQTTRPAPGQPVGIWINHSILPPAAAPVQDHWCTRIIWDRNSFTSHQQLALYSSRCSRARTTEEDIPVWPMAVTTFHFTATTFITSITRSRMALVPTLRIASGRITS